MALIDLGKQPVSEQAPTGSDIRYEPDFEALSDEVEKMSSPTASGAVDWQRVADLAADILAHASKDLLVACYLNIALMQTQGLKGLATGARVLRDLLETFWDGLYPSKKRLKGRLNAVVWWKERIDGYLPAVPSETWPKADRDALLGDLSAINEFLGQQSDDAPILNALIKSVSDRVAEEQAPAPPPPTLENAAPAEDAEEPAAPAQAETPPAPRTAAPVAPAGPPRTTAAPVPSDGDTPPGKLVENGLDLLDQAANGLMARDPFDPAIYRLNRVVAWFGVDRLPPSDGGKTLLPPPDGVVSEALTRLYQSGAWQDLLEAAEGRIREFLFWLDLSRYTAEALSQLGQAAVADQVAQDTLNYARRLKGIETLTFSDGMPFADPDTCDWLRQLAGDTAGATGPHDRTGDDMADALKAANDLLKKNQLGDALNGLRQRMERAGSTRERFLWQMGICRLLIRARKASLARPYIDESLALIDQHQLEKWEPALASDALAIALQGLKGIEGDTVAALTDRIANRLSFLDPVKALEFLG